MPVNYELSEHVAFITSDRPEKLNAIDPEMWRDFGKATERFLAADTAWVAIVTGSWKMTFFLSSLQ